MSAAVSSRPMTSSGRTKRCISAEPTWPTELSGDALRIGCAEVPEMVAQASTAKTRTAIRAPDARKEEAAFESVGSALRVIMMAKAARIATAPTYTRICVNPTNWAPSCMYNAANPTSPSDSARTQCTRFFRLIAAAVPMIVMAASSKKEIVILKRFQP